MATMAQQRGRGRRRGGLLGTLSKSFTDPGKIGGSIDSETWTIAPKDAMNLRSVAVAEVGMEREGKGETVIALELRGNINTTNEEVNPLILCSPDGAALLVSQIIGLVRRGRTGPEFDQLLAIRMEEAVGGGG